MPTYDYLCGKCGHRFEAFQAITDKPLGKCPSCGGNKVKRLIGTGAGIIFKGSGFYCTDYKKSGSKPPDSPSTDSQAKPDKPASSPKAKSDGSGKND